MALVAPPKDYYRLDSVAKEWGCTVEDLLDYGEQGKLEICIRLHHDKAWCYEVDEMDGEEYANNMYPESLVGPCPLSHSDVINVRQSLPISFFLPRQSDKSIGIDGWRLDKPLTVHHDSESLVITHEEKTRFQAEFEAYADSGLPASEIPTSNGLAENLDDKHVSPTPAGPLLVGWKAIAKELGVHPDTVRKNYSKNQTFPLQRVQTGNGNGLGKPAAFASELKAWRLSKNK